MNGVVDTFHWCKDFIGVKIKSNKKTNDFILKNLKKTKNGSYASKALGIHAKFENDKVVAIWIKHSLFDKTIIELI